MPAKSWAQVSGVVTAKFQDAGMPPREEATLCCLSSVFAKISEVMQRKTSNKTKLMFSDSYWMTVAIPMLPYLKCLLFGFYKKGY